MEIETLKAGFAVATEYGALLIQVLAFLIILAGTIQAFTAGIATAWNDGGSASARQIWIRYARWLVAVLTFQLAADIIVTSVSPGWEEIGMLATVAVIPTFLTYFLDLDIESIRERQDALSESAESLVQDQSVDA